MIFWAYVRSRWKYGLSLLVIFGIFGMVYYLTNAPMEACLYSIQLSLVFCFFAVGKDYLKFRRKHGKLSEFAEMDFAEMDMLPAATDLLEQDYQDILALWMKKNRQLITEKDKRYSDTRSYYLMWAHQIKTPISALRLLLQLDDDRKYTSDMEQEIFKIEQYVELALQFIRMEHLSNDLTLKEYDLASLVRNVVKKYSVIFINKKLTVDIEDVHGTVLTDEKWLSLILEQLLSNALKYTNEGGVRFYMDRKQEQTLVIEDTGIGIREEDIPRLFEKGFTGYNGRMDKKSTGIGLFMSREIAEKLGHRITIRSELGRGTAVSLDLRSDKLEIF